MLAITGLGMMTAVGYGATGTLAALRAGVSRPVALRTFSTDDGEGGEGFVTAHPVTGYAEGFWGPGAWARLALGAFADLVHRSELPADAGFWRRTGLTLLAPAADPARFPELLAEVPDAWERLYAMPVAKALRRSWAEGGMRVLGLGHGGLAEALQQAHQDVVARRVERVVVLAADSYLDGESLAWLSAGRRLKSAGVPLGLQPGEAGVAVLVEGEATARARSALRGGRVRAVASREVPGARKALGPAELGRALAESGQSVLRERRPFRGEVVLDTNGEAWRALAWGHAQMLLTREFLDFEHCRLTVPAECLGELGAASAPLGLGVAVGSLLREDTPEGQALVLSLSESGRGAAVHLTSV